MITVSKFTLSQFDPITFLGLDHLETSRKKVLKPRLLNNISEYLLIRLLDFLPEDADEKIKFTKIKSVEELQSILEKYIPDFKKQLNKFLLEFKEKYQKNSLIWKK